MTDATFIEGVDPHDAFDREAARIEARLAAMPDGDPAWAEPSLCDGWTVRDVLAHLLATEAYHAACLEGTVADFLGALAERGATDIASFNDITLHDLDGMAPSALLADWTVRDAVTRAGFRERGDGEVDSSVGAYPARWQAFHLASELATHADDMRLTETDDERAWRTAWRAPFSRFALTESKPELSISVESPGRTRVQGDGVDLELDDETFVAAVAGRLDDPDLAPLSTAV